MNLFLSHLLLNDGSETCPFKQQGNIPVKKCDSFGLFLYSGLYLYLFHFLLIKTKYYNAH